MNFLVLTPDYPDKRRAVFSFVKQLVDEMARQGHSIQVIAPYSISHNNRFCESKSEYQVESGKVIVYRPLYVSVSNIKVGSISLTEIAKRLAYRKGLNSLEEEPDVVYGHFWDSAYMGFNYAQSKGVPLFVATGESAIEFRCDSPQKKAFCDYVSGVICVSSKNRDESIKLGLTIPDKCVVVPNAINSNLFKKMDKDDCRKFLGFPNDAFIVSFVGWFSERKGSKRVSEAISRITEGEAVYSIFIGEGAEEPDCQNILFKGKLSHEAIPKYLNAADVFVLPTLQEGCCNAIIEAMACGLPIISSNLQFNWDVLNETNSIMVDPINIEEISQAIMTLRRNKELRKKLSDSALKTAESLTIDKRTAVIVGFLKNRWLI